jgi:ribosomal protein S11
MNKRLVINVLLIAFLCGLALIVWLKPGQQQETAIKLTNIDPSAIHTISIQRKNADSIVMSLVGDQWKITSPIQALALPSKVERLLKISQINVTTEYPLESQSLERFNLIQPNIKVSFNNTMLSIGNTEPVQHRRYVANTTSLFLVDDTFTHHLTAPINQYIDTRLFSDDIQIKELKTPTMHLRREQDNTWQTHPISSKEPLSADAVQTLLDEWRFARAIKVNSKKTGHSKPDVIVTLNNGNQYIFTLTKTANNVILTATDSQLNYHLSADKYKRMTNFTSLPDA